jgi:hypothetical protein
MCQDIVAKNRRKDAMIFSWLIVRNEHPTLKDRKYFTTIAATTAQTINAPSTPKKRPNVIAPAPSGYFTQLEPLLVLQ